MTSSEAALNNEELIEGVNARLIQRIATLSIRAVIAEDKLTKALAALDEAIYLLNPDEEDMAKEAGVYRIVTTYKELNRIVTTYKELKGET